MVKMRRAFMMETFTRQEVESLMEESYQKGYNMGYSDKIHDTMEAPVVGVF